MLYVCGIIANPSIAGRIFCWTNEGTVLWSLYWGLYEILASADRSVQEEMLAEWKNDLSESGYDRCMAAAEKDSSVPRENREDFDRSVIGADFRTLSAAPIIGAKCSDMITGAF